MRSHAAFLFPTGVIALSLSSIAQSAAPNAAQARPTFAPPIPIKISECEFAEVKIFFRKVTASNCGTWTWNGVAYDAQWTGVKVPVQGIPPGVPTTATVTMDRNGDNVTLHRTDKTGTKGVTATYTGTLLNDNTASGSVSWFLGDSPKPYATGTWNATLTMPVAIASQKALDNSAESAMPPASHVTEQMARDAVPTGTGATSAPDAKIPPDIESLSAEDAAGHAAIEVRARNYPLALRLYQVAESKGVVRAEVAIGILYLNGLGVPQNYAEALRRFEDGARKGDSLAMVNAANLYLKGEGTAADKAKSDAYLQQWNNRLAEFYPVCSSQPVKQKMLDLLSEVREGFGAKYGLLDVLFEDAFKVEVNGNPTFTVIASRVMDVKATDEFVCDAMIALAPEQNVVTPTTQTDADVFIASVLANSAVKGSRIVQSFRISPSGPGGHDFSILLNEIGSPYAPGQISGSLKQTYTATVSLK